MKSWNLLLLALVTAVALPAQNLDWSVSMGGSGSEAGRAVAVDAAGNVYVTGNFAGTVDFDPGPGTLTLTASSPSNMFVQKLNPSGNLLWAKAMTGTDYSRPYDIAVDAAGNVYSTGFFAGDVDFDPGAGTSILSSGSAIWRNAYVQKLDANGNLAWAIGYGGPNEDFGYGIAVDGNGDIVVVGAFTGTADFDPGAGTSTLSATNGDSYVLKLTAAGTFVWAKSMTTGASGGDDYAYAVATDASNNIYLTGSFGGQVDFDPGAGVTQLTALGAFPNGYVQKLDASGNLVWVRQAAANGFSDGHDIAVCANGDVLATGIFQFDIDGDPGATNIFYNSMGGFDGYIYRLSSSGNLVWFHTLGGQEDDYARTIDEDALGNVFLAGDFMGTVDMDPGAGVVSTTAIGLRDIFLLQLQGNGNYVNHLNMGGSQGESAFELVCANQSQYLTGYFQDAVDLDPYSTTANHASAGAEDAYVLKLNGTVVGAAAPQAAPLWAAFPNPSAGKFQLAGFAPAAVQQVQVTDMAGRVVPVAVQRDAYLELDLGAYPAGIYHATVRAAGRVHTLRLVRE